MKIKVKDNFPTDEECSPAEDWEIALRGQTLETDSEYDLFGLTPVSLPSGKYVLFFPEEFEVVES